MQPHEFKAQSQSKMAEQFLKVALVQGHKVRQPKTHQPKVKISMSKHDDDNRSRQLNPENDAYWQSRGEDERPDDWQERAEEES